jgi:hypothetical protein
MLYRLTAPLTLALAAAAIPLGAQSFRYAPGTATYDASVVTNMTRDIGGQRMEDQVTQRQRLTVSLTPGAADTMQIGVTIDTASLVSRTGPQDISQLIGLKVAGKVSPLGHVYSSRLASGDLGPAGPMVAGELAKILPRMRADLRVGLAWTDTIAEQVEMLGVPIDRRTIVKSRVVGDTTLAGERGWRVDRSAEVSFSGSGTMQGQAFTLRGTSNADGLIVIGRSGRYLASAQTDSVKTDFTAQGTSFSVIQTQKTTVALAR